MSVERRSTSVVVTDFNGRILTIDRDNAGTVALWVKEPGDRQGLAVVLSPADQEAVAEFLRADLWGGAR